MIARGLLFLIALQSSVVLANDRLRLIMPSYKSLMNRFERPLVPSQEKTAVLPEPHRLVAVGDIHGDFESLTRILREMNLIDRTLNWVGADAVLVQTGDFVARGTQSRQVLDLLMKLEIQAEYSGGRVITLLGNHESYVMRGDYSKLTLADGHSFLELIDHRGPVKEQTLKDAISFAMSENSPYGRWLVERPAMIQIGRRLFVHGGIEKWIENLDYDRVNATVKAWLRHWQNPASNRRPPSGSEWVFGPHGPLMTRRVSKGATDESLFKSWLDKMNLDTVVVGHTKVRDLATMTNNPKYGDKLIMIDTAISEAGKGSLSAVEFRPGYPALAHVFSRTKTCRQVHF